MEADTIDPQSLVQQALDAMRTHNWVMLFALILMVSIWAARWGGSKIPGRVGAFIASTRGAVALNFLMSFVGVVVASLAAKRPLGDAGLWKAALTASVAAAGGWSQLKGIFFPSDAPPLHQVVKGMLRKTPPLTMLLALLSVFMAIPACTAAQQQQAATIKSDLMAQCGSKYATVVEALKPAVLGILTSGLPQLAIGQALLALVPLVIDGLPAIVCTVQVVIADLKQKTAMVKGEVDPRTMQAIDYGGQFLKAHVTP